MTGKEKIRAAFSPEGTPEFGVVICYEGIFIRDHWQHLTDQPWYAMHLPNIETQLKWHSDVISKINQDWFVVYPFYSKQEQETMKVEIYTDKIFLVDTKTQTKREIAKPNVSGWSVSGRVQSVKIEKLPETISDLEKLLPERPEKFERKKFLDEGRHKLSQILIKRFDDKIPICHVASPLWRLYGIFGFEGMMTMIKTKPELVLYACERFLEISINLAQQYIATGAEILWLEECLTDMISPFAFEKFNVPFMKRLVSAIKDFGGKSIYYYCGNPWDRMGLILEIGADAISFEEGKKGFEIDIERVVDAVGGRCVVLGNLDAINLLPNADIKTLKEEIKRQLEAGKRNKRKFVMSIGSPVTPETTLERVNLYCSLARELGAKL